MDDGDMEPGLVLPRGYEAALRAGCENGLVALQLAHNRKLEELQEAYEQELLRRSLELSDATEEGTRLKLASLASQRKLVLYKTKLASVEEKAQQLQQTLNANEALVKVLTEQRETLLSENNALQEQVQTLTQLCQGQHRARVAQQGQLSTTDAEAKQFYAQFLQTSELSERLARQLAEARSAHEKARHQIRSLQQQLANEQAQTQAQASAHATLQSDCEKLRASITDGEAARAGLRADIAKLEAELQVRSEELQAQALAHAALQAECNKLRGSVAESGEARVGLGTYITKLEMELQGRSAEAQALSSARAALQTECDGLRASVADGQRARAGLEAHIAKLESDIQACSAQLKAAEQRLVQSSAQREEQRLQELQRLRAADGVIIQELQLDVEKLTERLVQGRRIAEQEHKLLHDRLQRELAAREVLERECAEKSRQLREEHDSHASGLAQLRRQMHEKAAELQQAIDNTRRLEEQLAAAEKRAATRMEQISDLEAALERSSQKLCRHVNGNDAAVGALQEQLEQQRRKLEEKEVELHDAQNAHARQIVQLQQRLAQQEATAREQEAQLQQHSDSARQLQHQADVAMRQAGHAETQLQERVAELQASLAAHDEHIKQLTDGQAAEASQRDRRLRQQQAGHVAEVARLEARIRELEHQLTIMPSPAEPQRNQVRSAAAAVDKLMGNLLGSGLGLGCLREMDEDDDDYRGPSADHILGMSQPNMSHGLGDLPMFQQLAAAAAAAAAPPAATATVAAPAPAVQRDAQQPATAAGGATAAPRHAQQPAVAVAASAGGLDLAMAAADGAAKKAESGKRGLEASAGDEERPAGRGRSRKAAKVTKGQPTADAAADPGPTTAATAATAAATADGSKGDPSEEQPPDAGPAARVGSRRRAAQAGQARAKAMAAALADESETDSMPVDTPGFEVKGPRTRRATQRTGTQAPAPEKAASAKPVASSQQTASGDSEVSVPAEVEAGAAETKRGRAGARRGKAGVQATDAEAKPAVGKAAVTSHPEARPIEPAQDRDPAELMPPPRKAVAGPRGGVAGAKLPDTDVETAPASQVFDLVASQQPTQQLASQPPTQRQPPPAPANAVAAPGDRPNASQQALPTASRTSLFSQGFLSFDGSKSKNPLATLNPRLLEQANQQAKNRGHLVPFTAIQQWKIQTPSICKAGNGKGQPRPLPQVTSGQLAVAGTSVVPGDALPPDMLLRTLQQHPNKTGKKGA